MDAAEVDRIVRQVLDEYSRAPAGAPGLRRLGTGATSAAVGTVATAPFVTTAASTSLSSERVLTAGADIAITDAGAGSTVTVALNKPALKVLLSERFI